MDAAAVYFLWNHIDPLHFDAHRGLAQEIVLPGVIFRVLGNVSSLGRFEVAFATKRKDVRVGNPQLVDGEAKGVYFRGT